MVWAAPPNVNCETDSQICIRICIPALFCIYTQKWMVQICIYNRHLAIQSGRCICNQHLKISFSSLVYICSLQLLDWQNFVGCSCILHSQPPNIRPALLATPLLRALPTHVSTVTVIVLSDLVFYCDHFPEIWEPRRFFSVEIQWFNMGAPKNN